VGGLLIESSLIVGIISVAFGILIIWQPKLLAYMVAAYFIIVGICLILYSLA